MGVYIKGMKMPENCCDCLLSEESTFLQGMGNIVHCGWVCGVIHEPISEQGFYSGRLLKCPLVEVSEPHGRLIDSEKLKNEYPHDTDWDYPVNTNHYVCWSIDNASTVIESESNE